jgi:DNA-binding FadR family transcriptional regulator
MSPHAERKAGSAPARAFGVIPEALKSDRVVAELERRILDGVLQPGERLPTESELCEMLHVSRSVVRDAMRTLAARGLISIRQGHGTTVTHPGDSVFAQAFLLMVARSDLTIGQVLDARMALDTALVPLLIANGQDKDWVALDAILERFANVVEASEWDDAIEAHLAFHTRLLGALHQPALELMLRPMQEIIVASASPPRLTQKEDWEVDTHPPIIDGLRRRDVPAAQQAFQAHYQIAHTPRYEGFRDRKVKDVLQTLPWSRR